MTKFTDDEVEEEEENEGGESKRLWKEIEVAEKYHLVFVIKNYEDEIN